MITTIVRFDSYYARERNPKGISSSSRRKAKHNSNGVASLPGVCPSSGTAILDLSKAFNSRDFTDLAVQEFR
jgi:hypothetical protein